MGILRSVPASRTIDAGLRFPRVFTTAEAIQRGYSHHMIETRVRRGEWRRLRRGVYCLTSIWDQADPRERHVLTAESLVRASRSSIALSHATAAILWDLPQPLDQPLIVTATRPSQHGATTRVDPGTVIQAAQLPPIDRSVRTGLPVTSLARTAADCLRHLRAVDAMAVADAAVRSGNTGPSAIGEVLARQADWPYASRAAARLPLVDGRRESWLESASAVVLHQEGVPLAQPQVEIFDRQGRFVARVDMLWAGDNVVGEADGLGKYDLGASGDVDEARRQLINEKRRQERLEDLGLVVVRWGSRELLCDPAGVASSVQRARARGRANRFTGHLRPRAA